MSILNMIKSSLAIKDIQIDDNRNVSVRNIDNSIVVINLLDEADLQKFKEDILQGDQALFIQLKEEIEKILHGKSNESIKTQNQIEEDAKNNFLLLKEQNEKNRTLLKNASFDLSKINNYFGEYEDSHINRTETESIFNWVNNDLQHKQKNIAILVGNGGLGKTVILKDLYDLLELNNIPTLGIKADKYYASERTELEKKIFQLPDTSISDVLNSLSKSHKKIVVIIDQLDALSQTLSTQREFLTAYNRLINELSGNNKLRIVISIRKFDLEYDAELSIYKKNEYDHFETSFLSLDKVKEILYKVGVTYPSNKLIDLLKIPNNLNVFCKLKYKENANVGNLSSLKDLYDALWNEIVVEIQNENELKIRPLLYEIAVEMNRRQEVTIYNSFNDKYSKELNYLKSRAIVFQENNRIQFFHQSFYDYVFSKQFVENGCSLVESIIENNQSLYIRSVVKMVLEYLREYSPTLYLETIKQIIEEKQYRFHIKSLVITGIALSLDIIKGEKKIVANYIFPNQKYAEVFIGSVISEVWFQYIIEKNTVNKYLNESLEDSLSFKEKEAKINLIWRFLRNNISRNLDLVLNCLDILPNFQNKDNIVTNLLFFIERWENKRLLPYFEEYTYSQINHRENHSFYDQLKKIAVYHKVYVFEKFKPVLFNLFCQDYSFSISLNHEEEEFLNKLYELYPKETFEFLFLLMHEIVDAKKIEGIFEKIDSPLYKGFYFSDMVLRGGTHENGDDFIFRLLTQHIKIESSNNTEFFIQIYEKYKNCNSIPVLKLLIMSLSESTIYYKYFLEIIEIVDKKNGFKGYDDRFSFCLRKLIIVYYPTLNQKDKDRIADIILDMKSVGDIYIYEKEGKKKVYLGDFGKKQYMYLKELPKAEIQNNIYLKKRYQELERKFGEVKEELLSRSKFIMGGVGTPLTGHAYKKMNFKSWEKSMNKYNEAYKRDMWDGSFKGDIKQHSRAFEEEVKLNVEKYKDLVEKIILENTVAPAYMVSGLRGLIEGEFNPLKSLPLYKILIKCNLDRSHTLYCVWMCDYFIQNQIVDIEIVAFLSNLALNHEDPAKLMSESDPSFDSLNTVRGAAIHKLIRCYYNPEFKDIIFDTVEKAAKDLQPSVKVAILQELAFLNHFDEYKSFKIFMKLVNTDEPKILKHSIWSASYFRNKYFNEMKGYFHNLIEIEALHQEAAKLIFPCWYYKEIEDAESLLEMIITKSDKAKLAILHVADDYLFMGNQLNQKCMNYFERFLSHDNEQFAHTYSILILQKFTIDNFKLVYSFLKKYAKSKHCALNKTYFLKYLITCAKEYPNECLELIELVNFDYTPDIQKSSYHDKEPLLAVLAIYCSLIAKEEDDVLVERSLNIFDYMLQNEFFSSYANEALETL